MRRKEEREMENLWKTVTENVGFIVVIAITAAVLFAVAKLGEMWAGVTSSQQMRTKKNCHYRYDVSACIYSADL